MAVATLVALGVIFISFLKMKNLYWPGMQGAKMDKEISRNKIYKNEYLEKLWTVYSDGIKNEYICKWEVDEDGIWNTECENAFCFDVDGPKENRCKFCPFCGRPLVIRYKNDHRPETKNKKA